ncbi:MAG TPA: hypothetical protein VF334_00805 [Polyangia bacterium]
MRFYHKLAILGLLALSGRALAQPAAPPVPQDQDVDDDGEGMPPPDPNAYPQEGPPVAQVPQYGYMGPHPIPYEAGQGFCYQQGAHFHEYAPFDENLFREQNGWFYFVGDAADFGYSQQMWGYQGNHPIPGAYGGGYCFIDWPHRHHYPPPANLAFNFVGGYYVYGGPWDPWYWRMRPHYQAYYGGYYRHSYYGGIYWRTRPAPVYRPRIVVGAPGYYRPGAVVVAPGRGRVVVGAPHPGYAPRPGGVVVGAPRPYAPGPRPGGVVVGAPRPYAPGPRPGGGVVVGAPRPIGAPGPRPVAAPHPMGGGGGHVAAPPARGGGGGGHHR